MAFVGDAIDYRKLYLDEKRKARQRNQGRNIKTSSKTSQEDNSDPSQHLPQWLGNSSALQVPHLNEQSDCVSRDNPARIFYRDTFLPSDFCNDLWQWLGKLPLAADEKTQKSGHWHVLPYAKRKVAVFDDSFPPPLQILVQALVKAGFFDESALPNHILINHYTQFQGIMPHTDGPAYFSRTATISLGDGEVLLRFEPREKGAFVQRQLLLRGRGSLVVFGNDAYSQCMHSIDEVYENCEMADSSCCNAPAGTLAYRKERISLTVRHRFALGSDDRVGF